MGYKISVWSSDYGIASTHIVVTDKGTEKLKVTKHYPDTVYEAENLTGTASFTATPAASYKFKQWVYRIGGDDGEQQTSDQNPFYYTGADHNNAELLIRAESENAWGGDDNTLWSVSDIQIGYVDSHVFGEPIVHFLIAPRTIYRFECKFRNSGKARIFTQGYTDTVGYISTARDFHESSGEPYFIDEWASDNGYDTTGNFLFEWNVVADTTYYVWVRGQEHDTEGDTYLYIEAPEAEPDEPDEPDTWSLTKYTFTPGEHESYELREREVYRISMTFTHAGKAKFYSTGDIDTYGWLSTSDGFNDIDGVPTSPLTNSDDTDSTNKNFSFEWDVTAGITYYLWVKNPSGTETGEFLIYVEPPAPVYWAVTKYDRGTVTTAVSAMPTISPLTAVRYAVKFSRSGEAKFTSSLDPDLRAYLSTTEDFDTANGMPMYPIDYDDDSGGSTNFSITKYVKAGTQYYLWVRGKTGQESGTGVIAIFPPTEGVNVAKWDWNLSNGAATAKLTTAAHTAVLTQGAVANFSFRVWNDLCSKVAAVLDASGKAWDNKYDTYLNTKMSPSDKELTAKRFNSLRYNIGSHYSTGIKEEDVAPGKDVLGSYFITLASCVNNWIDTL